MTHKRRQFWFIGFLACMALLLVVGLVVTLFRSGIHVSIRAVELLDYTENILGVAVGTGISWLAHRLIQRRAAPSP